MTRKIKAQDVKPGMEIEWTNRGVTYRCLVDDVPDPAFDGQGNQDLNIIAAGWPHDPKKLSLGCFQEVTVLKEAQPPEPLAFGACVEVAGVKYVRCDDDHLEWKGAENFGWWGWDSLCDKGHVTVVNADPFATVQAEPEHRVWDRWEDVPDMVAVRSTTGNAYRKAPDGTERQTLDGEWGPSIMATSMMRSRAPFTEERDA